MTERGSSHVLAGSPRQGMGIRGKFFLVIFPVTALAIILFTVMVVELSSRQSVARNRIVAESIAERNARLLAPVLWNIDFEGQNRVLEVIVNETRLLCVRLYEDNPVQEGDLLEISLAGQCSAIPENAYRVDMPVLHDTGEDVYRVGMARHWFDISRDPKEVRDEVLGFSLLSLVMYAILGLAINIGFQRVLIAPIRAIERSLKKYNETGLREKTDWRSDDELGRFINAYNEGVDRQNRSEAELLEAKEAAEKALRELQLAKDSLVQAEKLASLGSLVAGIAHEINTPVGSCLTVATALQQRTARFDETMAAGNLKKSTLNGYVADVTEAASILVYSLHSAAEQIKKFKQVAVDQTSAQRRAFSLATVVEEVLSTLRPRIKHRPIEVDFRCDSDVTMNSYPGPLGQVISNLFTNAVLHAFPDDQGGLIRISIRKEKEGVVLDFSDNGMGMDEDQRKHLYDPFYTTRMGSGGSGLGMHIVFNIVTTMLGGKITLDSEPGKGAHFTIELPLTAPHAKDRERRGGNMEQADIVQRTGDE